MGFTREIGSFNSRSNHKYLDTSSKLSDLFLQASLKCFFVKFSPDFFFIVPLHKLPSGCESISYTELWSCDNVSMIYPTLDRQFSQ